VTLAGSFCLEGGRTVVSEIETVAQRLQERADALPQAFAHRRAFLEAYARMTRAVGAAVDAGRFEDPEWVAAWDVDFAERCLQAHEADQAGSEVSRPWRLAFGAAEDLSALQHVLLALNAHVNYDLPQALLEVISDGEFADSQLLARRRRDYDRIDAVLAARVAEEEARLMIGKTQLDRVLTPLNRLASKRFLRESRQKVWHNTEELHRSRLAGPDAYRDRLADLEVLTAGRIIDLLAPGHVLLRLAVVGFGVTLPPP
jgi:hypothetical protein